MLYYVPESPELIFRGHHHTIDGTSVLLFCTATLAPQLKDIEFGDELAWPIPIVEEVLGYPEQLTPVQSEKATALFRSGASNIPQHQTCLKTQRRWRDDVAILIRILC